MPVDVPKTATSQSQGENELANVESKRVVVRARRVVQAYDKSRSVDVIPRERSERAVVNDLGEMLEEVGGVTVQKTTPASAVPILRGVTGNRVLTMYHDIRLNDGLTRAGGNELLRLIDLESVDAIEVVRGPGSVRYGSDALGGVIRVIPADVVAKRGEPSRWGSGAQLKGSTSNAGTQARAYLSAKSPWLGMRASGTYGRYGDMSAGGGLEQAFTSYSEYAGSFRLSLPIAGRQHIGLALHSAQVLDAARPAKSKPGDVRKLPLNAKETGYVWYRGKRIYRGLNINARVGVSRRRAERSRIREEKSDQFEHDEVRSLFFRIEAEKIWWPGPELLIGIDADLESITSGASEINDGVSTSLNRGRYVDGSDYGLLGAFSLLQYRWGNTAQVAAGGRGSLSLFNLPTDPLFPVQGSTETSTFGWAATAGISYLPVEQLTLSLNALRGFRAPNLEDLQALGEGSRGYSIPPGTLKPEISTTLELGAAHLSDMFQVRAYLYGTLFEDEIIRIPTSFEGESLRDGSPYITRANARSTQLTGFELGARRKLGALWLGLGVSGTLGSTERGDEEEPASKIPPITGSASVSYDAPEKRWRLELIGRGEGPQPRLSPADKQDVRICFYEEVGCDRTKAWATLDLRGGYRLAKWALLSLEAENLLDVRYHPYASGIEGSGLSINASLRLSN